MHFQFTYLQSTSRNNLDWIQLCYPAMLCNRISQYRSTIACGAQLHAIIYSVPPHHRVCHCLVAVSALHLTLTADCAGDTGAGTAQLQHTCTYLHINVHTRTYEHINITYTHKQSTAIAAILMNTKKTLPNKSNAGNELKISASLYRQG